MCSFMCSIDASARHDGPYFEGLLTLEEVEIDVNGWVCIQKRYILTRASIPDLNGGEKPSPLVSVYRVTISQVPL